MYTLLKHTYITRLLALPLAILPSLLCAQTKPDSITVRAGARYDSVGSVHRFLLGNNYRKEWAAPVKVRIVDLSKEKGGMTIEQKGGGMQTRSLRLKAKDGHEWVLRSIQKFPERILPPALRAGLTKAIIDDQVTTGNPFAALTVPSMAEALGVPHSNPEIIYIANDPVLGKYQKEFANDLYLFEEREPLESEDTDNTHKVQKKLREDNDVKIDAKLALRARILDMVIGDWDRHDDQWRWDKDKTKKETVYTAIPRDRDQVYYKTSGVLPWFVAHQWLKAKFQPFKPEIRDIKSWNLNGMYFDRYFLAEMDEKDWKEQIQYVQSHLTNEVITKAMHRMPPQVFAISGEELIKTVMARRDNMSKQGMDYYRFLSAQVDVAASEKNEEIKVTIKDGGKVKLTISNIKKDNTIGREVFERTFDPDVTKEVRVYGYGGGDKFNVTGSGSSPIRFRLVGAKGVDTFTVAKEVDNKRSLYIYDRSDEANVLPDRKQARIHTAADTSVTFYDRKNYQYDRPQPIVSARYNNDYGVILTAGFAYTKYGFRKAPYDWHQELLVDYAFGRKSWRIHYNGDFKQAVGNNDVMIHFTSRGPDNISNFFGIGNNTQFEKDSEWIKFFRNRYDYLYGDARLAHTYGKVKLSAGVTGQYYHAYPGDNNGRYLQVYNLQNPGEQVFSNKTYAGLITGAQIDTRNNLLMPTKGVYFEATMRGLQQLNQDHARYGQLLSEFSFYVDVLQDSTFILATRFGGGTTIGDPEYFQQLKLGGSDNLRGFRTWRFTGRSMLYNNVEARIKLFDFNSYLFPGRLGLIAFNDIGRVWTPGESSSKWHDGYGGGLFLIPAQLLMIQATLARSHEGKFVYVNLGYRF